MRGILSVNAKKLLVASLWRDLWRALNEGTRERWRPYVSRGKLLKRRRFVDIEGRWWVEETRHDLYTGLIITETRRITD